MEQEKNIMVKQALGEPKWVTALMQQKWPNPFEWTLARLTQLILAEMEELDLEIEAINARERLLEHRIARLKGEESGKDI